LKTATAIEPYRIPYLKRKFYIFYDTIKLNYEYPYVNHKNVTIYLGTVAAIIFVSKHPR